MLAPLLALPLPLLLAAASPVSGSVSGPVLGVDANARDATTADLVRTRLAVQDPDGAVLGERGARLFSNLLVRELRKLDGVAVTGMDEVRALLSQEANRQLIGCGDQSCLAEIADALGADVVVTAAVGAVGDTTVVSVKALSTHGDAPRTVEKRLAHVDGTEAFAALGEIVAELFPDRALQHGQTRGVPAAIARSLNPPPLSSTVFAVSATGTGVLAVGAAVVGAAAVVAKVDVDALAARAADETVSGRALQDGQRAAEERGLVAGVVGGAAAVGLVVTLVMIPFTDFAGAGAVDDDG